MTDQIGVAPGRIDILTELTDLTFDEAWDDRLRRPFGEIAVDFIGRRSFIRTSGPRDARRIWPTLQASAISKKIDSSPSNITAQGQ